MNTSVIIPTFNKLPRLRFVLKSLLLLEDKDHFEVVIVDDGSTDGTEQILNQFLFEAEDANLHLQVKRIKNSGRSVARNRGVDEAAGELLIFTDDDLILSPHFVREHQRVHQANTCQVVRGVIYQLQFLKFFKNPETGELFDPCQKIRKGLLSHRLSMDVIEPSLRMIRRQARFDKFEEDIRQLYAITSKNHTLRWIGCTGGNVSVRKKDFVRVGGFDPNMGRGWGCEDLELGYRLKKIGARFLMADQAENFHISHFRVTTGSEHEQAMAYFIAQHPDQEIAELNQYFQGTLSSLVEWKAFQE